MFTREELSAIYEEALENDTRPANREEREWYDKVNQSIEMLMDTLIEENFKWGYQLGYEAGRKSA